MRAARAWNGMQRRWGVMGWEDGAERDQVSVIVFCPEYAASREGRRVETCYVEG